VRVQVITGGSSTGSTQQHRRHSAWAQGVWHGRGLRRRMELQGRRGARGASEAAAAAAARAVAIVGSRAARDAHAVSGMRWRVWPCFGRRTSGPCARDDARGASGRCGRLRFRVQRRQSAKLWARGVCSRAGGAVWQPKSASLVVHAGGPGVGRRHALVDRASDDATARASGSISKATYTAVRASAARAVAAVGSSAAGASLFGRQATLRGCDGHAHCPLAQRTLSGAQRTVGRAHCPCWE
jgi:hypothetical protein